MASLLVKEMRRLKIMVEGETGKELTFIMDNCSGQNKNRMVLRLATYLVEANYFEKVSFVFYIVGHTKNACDRWFNTLKRSYRRQNIYSFECLIKSMQTHKDITVTEAKEEDFKDWDAFFNTIYKLLAPGTTHRTHIFTAEMNNKTTLLFRDDDLPDTQAKSQDLMKKGTNTPNRQALLESPNLNTIKPPGIPPIKQVELFSKYRSLIPLHFREITCPDPGDDIKSKIKSERNAKSRERSKKQRMMKKEEAQDKEEEQDKDNKESEPAMNDDCVLQDAANV